MITNTAFGEQVEAYLRRFVYMCIDIYTWTVMNYGGRDAMYLFFGVFAVISLALIRAEMRRKIPGLKRVRRTPGQMMVIKAVEGGARFFASAALVLGFMAMAHNQNIF